MCIVSNMDINDMMVLDFLLDDFDVNIVQVVINEVDRPNDNIIPNNRIAPTYNQGYMENIVSNYNLSEFKSHFRMSRAAMEQLCASVAPYLQELDIYISLEKKVCFFIWILAKQESFLAVSDRFGFNKGTGHYIFKKILSSISQLKDQYIKWPNPAECDQIAARVENKSRIPGVVGAIDGTHIIIKQPTNNAIDFYNRKEQHSIILQGVCDDNRIFTDVFIGMPGRLHDARVFRNSPLFTKLVNDDPPLLPPNQHILGDAAYPLLHCLLKPYRDNGHLTGQQIRFNEVMSGQRSVIERAFGLLKGKWRRLKYLDMSLDHVIPEVVLVSCILHNFIIKRDSEDEDNYLGENGNNDQDEDGDNLNLIANNSGEIKRNYISTLL